MSIRNLHIFNDASGFFTNLTVQRVEKIDPENNTYLNQQVNSTQKNALVIYQELNEWISINDTSSIERVFFHGYEVQHVQILESIKRNAPKQTLFFWIFWSHEFYQLPENLKGLYTNYTRWYRIRKYFSFYVNYALLFFRGRSTCLLYPGLKHYRDSFKNMNYFCSLIEEDYHRVDPEQTMKYLPISYISLSEMHVPALDVLKINDPATIMLGHSASPLLNHEQVLDCLNKMRLSNKVLLPISYGKKSYATRLKKLVNKYPAVFVEIMEKYLPKEQYYQELSNVSCFILNSYCQQALGNILFFLATGTKVFLRKNTSTYQTLANKGFVIFSIDEDLTKEQLMSPLTQVDVSKNRCLLQDFISDERVFGLWKNILCYKSYFPCYFSFIAYKIVSLA